MIYVVLFKFVDITNNVWCIQRNVLISFLIYYDLKMISKQVSKSKYSYSCVIVNMFETQLNEMHKRFFFVNLLTW